jgi:hypothetical protein
LGIGVEEHHTEFLPGEGGGKMNGDGRFPHTPFLIEYRNNFGHSPPESVIVAITILRLSTDTLLHLWLSIKIVPPISGQKTVTH